MPELEYRRLTRPRNRSQFSVALAARSSLWLGKDHILQIETSGYTETYKRFYFRDIQALALCATQTWLYRAVVFAAFASFFGLIALLGGSPVLAWVFGIIAGLFALFLALELSAGPTARAYLRTAVQTESLVSLHRLRRARRVFDVLRPLILSAQPPIPPTGGTAAHSDLAGPPMSQGAPGSSLDQVVAEPKPAAQEQV